MISREPMQSGENVSKSVRRPSRSTKYTQKTRVKIETTLKAISISQICEMDPSYLVMTVPMKGFARPAMSKKSIPD